MGRLSLGKDDPGKCGHDKYANKSIHMNYNLDIEHLLHSKSHIVGADECGWGAWAGELVICGVKANKEWHLDGIDDSKKLTSNKRYAMRDKLIKCIIDGEISFHIAERTNACIDKLGASKALKECYKEVFLSLYSDDSLIVCDGTLEFNDPEINTFDKISLPKADGKISSVMAASILGKTYRDTMMGEHDKQYPGYDWFSNMGYGASVHRDGINKLGLTPLHRMSYAPMKHMKQK